MRLWPVPSPPQASVSSCKYEHKPGSLTQEAEAGLLSPEFGTTPCITARAFYWEGVQWDPFLWANSTGNKPKHLLLSSELGSELMSNKSRFLLPGADGERDREL